MSDTLLPVRALAPANDSDDNDDRVPSCDLSSLSSLSTSGTVHLPVLALDLGTTTGWAVKSSDGLIASGTFDFKPRRFEGGGMRYLRFNQALDQLLAASGGFQRLVFEEVRRHLGVDAAHVYGGLLATLTAWAERKNIPYEAVPVGTWKKVLTGKGNASKDEVIAAVTAKGFDPIDHNQADALGILLWLGQ